jgi:hypothetical protein
VHRPAAIAGAAVALALGTTACDLTGTRHVSNSEPAPTIAPTPCAIPPETPDIAVEAAFTAYAEEGRPDEGRRDCFSDFVVALSLDQAGRVFAVDLTLSGP